MYVLYLLHSNNLLNLVYIQILYNKTLFRLFANIAKRPSLDMKLNLSTLRKISDNFHIVYQVRLYR